MAASSSESKGLQGLRGLEFPEDDTSPIHEVGISMPASEIEMRDVFQFFRVRVVARYTQGWYIMRRYSEFRKLRDDLGDAACSIALAPFPLKDVWGKLAPLSGEKLEYRRSALELWINAILQHPNARGSWAEALRAFLEAEGRLTLKASLPADGVAVKDMIFYVALGVLPSATTAEIRQASKVQRELHDPDRGGEKKRYIAILEASSCLCDPDLRKEYNKIGPDAIRKHKMVEGKDPMKEWREMRTPAENNKFEAQRKHHYNEVQEMKLFQEKQAVKLEKRQAVMKAQEEKRIAEAEALAIVAETQNAEAERLEELAKSADDPLEALPAKRAGRAAKVEQAAVEARKKADALATQLAEVKANAAKPSGTSSADTESAEAAESAAKVASAAEAEVQKVASAAESAEAEATRLEELAKTSGDPSKVKQAAAEARQQADATAKRLNKMKGIKEVKEAGSEDEEEGEEGIATEAIEETAIHKEAREATENPPEKPTASEAANAMMAEVRRKRQEAAEALETAAAEAAEVRRKRQEAAKG